MEKSPTGPLGSPTRPISVSPIPAPTAASIGMSVIGMAASKTIEAASGSDSMFLLTAAVLFSRH
jgi:hypothetical protein